MGQPSVADRRQRSTEVKLYRPVHLLEPEWSTSPISSIGTVKLPAPAISGDPWPGKNILVVIDGAHSFAHLDYSVPDLGGDISGTSLHKWLSAPFGSEASLQSRQIAETWPLFASQEPRSEDIRKFEGIGDKILPSNMPWEKIDFQLLIGKPAQAETSVVFEELLDLPGAGSARAYPSAHPSSDWSGATPCFRSKANLRDQSGIMKDQDPQ